MNDKLVEICALRDQMYERMAKLDDALVQAAEIRRITDTVESLVKSVQNFGFNDAIVDKINSCRQFKDYCDVELSLKYKSVESLGEAAKEAFKKFWDKIIQVVSKIVEFFQDLFNTTASKCRQIIKDRSCIKFDRVVKTFLKKDIGDCMLAVDMCKNFCDQHVKITSEDVSSHSQLLPVMKKISENSAFLNCHDDGSLYLVAPAKKDMTLTDAGWDINDVTKMASAYEGKAKNYTALGQVFLAAYNFSAVNRLTTGPSDPAYAWIKQAAHANVSVYGIMLKLQNIVAQQIVTCYQCIDTSDVINV